ncbi:MAG: hypothetical protein ACREWE_09700 [Gammaproteobacteria bacterium]
MNDQQRYRRVFENVLIEARDQHMTENGMHAWPEFERASIDQRIKLSEHPHLYRILSLGVHQLTEEQCAHDRVNAIREQKQREAISRLLAQSVDRNKDR